MKQFSLKTPEVLCNSKASLVELVYRFIGSLDQTVASVYKG